MHFLLTYDYTDDYLARRGAFRDRHLQLAWDAQARGQILLAGALNDPADSAAFVFSCDNAAQIEQFVQADPYVINGLVRSYRIQPWTTVVGDAATTPLRPA